MEIETEMEGTSYFLSELASQLAQLLVYIKVRTGQFQLDLPILSTSHFCFFNQSSAVVNSIWEAQDRNEKTYIKPEQTLMYLLSCSKEVLQLIFLGEWFVLLEQSLEHGVVIQHAPCTYAMHRAGVCSLVVLQNLGCTLLCWANQKNWHEVFIKLYHHKCQTPGGQNSEGLC